MSPAGAYLANTCDADLSGFADFTPITTLTCPEGHEQQPIQFNPTLEKRSVPGSWATWGSPPDTESATPNILYTGGATSVTITYGDPSQCVGVEVEPNPFEVHTFTAVIAHGATTLKTITRDADGNAGARLLAACGKKDRDRLEATTMTISSDVDFSIAQVRQGGP